MSYKTYRIDDLMQLDRKTLTTALRIFQQELDGTINLLTQEPASVKDEVVLDDLEHLLTLRRVFKLRLDELEAEDQDEPGTSVQVLCYAGDYALLEVLKSDVTHAF
jgi:hypothetical protein